MSIDEPGLDSLRRAWAALPARLRILEPLDFGAADWSLLARLHARFNDREAHVRLPLPIARFRAAAQRAIHAEAMRHDGLATVTVGDGWSGDDAGQDGPDAMAPFAAAFNADVDAMMAVLVPSARYRKGHYAYGLFTAAAPHGLHTDHSAEDPRAGGEPICIARIATLGTHVLAGDERLLPPETRRMLDALRYWTPVPEGEPEAVLADLLRRGVLTTIPVDHVVLMVAGNRAGADSGNRAGAASGNRAGVDSGNRAGVDSGDRAAMDSGNRAEDAQVTQHIAARPPEGGVHSAFFQRQYRLG